MEGRKERRKKGELVSGLSHGKAEKWEPEKEGI